MRILKVVMSDLTIQEKMRYLNDISRLTELKINCTDKIKVRDYCIANVGIDLHAQIYGVWNSFEEIDFLKLPNKFMLKCNHGCAMNIPCFDKTTFDFKQAKEKLNKWVNSIQGIESKEYQYSKIDRKIFAEELLINSKEESLIDYRIWCFHGVPHFLGVNGGSGWGQIVFFDTDFKPYDLFTSQKIPTNIKELYNQYNKPDNFELMLKYAEMLSSEFKFVRVDMYNVNGSIYLGEMTFSPGGYNFHFKTSKGVSKDIEIGKLIKL